MEAGSRPAVSHSTATQNCSAPHRLTTETKAAFKTTEFALTIATIVGILIAAALIKGGDTDGTDEFIANQAWLYVAIVVLGYNLSRGLAKSGSREPYSDDGNDSRH